jgi:predicted neuraminidase
VEDIYVNLIHGSEVASEVTSSTELVLSAMGKPSRLSFTFSMAGAAPAHAESPVSFLLFALIPNRWHCNFLDACHPKPTHIYRMETMPLIMSKNTCHKNWDWTRLSVNILLLQVLLLLVL